MIVLTAKQDMDVLQAYRKAGLELVKKFNATAEGSATRAYYGSYIRSLHNDLEKIIVKVGMDAAVIPASVQKLMLTDAFKNAGMDMNLVKNFDKTFGKISSDSMARIISGGIYKDTKTLSDRIWGAAISSGNDIQNVVLAGMAQKSSAVSIAKALQAYVDPNTRKVWDKDKIKETLGEGYAAWNKNIEYNSLRLARTTLTHSFQISHEASCKNNPFVEGILWHSVLQHNRTCEVCRQRHMTTYKIGKVPLDHPNGLCYQTAVITKSLDEIGDEIKTWLDNGGGNNKKLDKWAKDNNIPTNNIKNVLSKVSQVNAVIKPTQPKAPQYKNITRADIESDVNAFYSKLSIQETHDVEQYVATVNSFNINRFLYEGNYADYKIDIDKAKAAGASASSIKKMMPVQMREADALSDVISKGSIPDDVIVFRNVGGDVIDSIIKQVGIDKTEAMEDVYGLMRGGNEQKITQLASDLNARLSGVQFIHESFMSTSFDATANVFTRKPVALELYAKKGTKALMTDNWDESEIVFDKFSKIEFIGFDVKNVKGRFSNEIKLTIKANIIE